MRHQFSLFITGTSHESEVAINNLKEIFESNLGNDYDLNVVNVLEEPETAEREKIIASPTLVLNNSRPSRRIVGNFSNRENVLKWLDFPEYKSNIK